MEEQDEHIEASGNEEMGIEQEYNSDLTTEHRYLGHDLEEVHGRTITEGGSIQSLLVLYSHVTVVPGEILPLKFYRPGEVNLLKELIKNNKLFGILDPIQSKSGTTAEIRSYKLEQSDEPPFVLCLTVIIEGVQQFQLLEKLTRDYPRFVKVRIVKDVTLQSPEKRLLLEGQRPRGLMATCSPWPRFVYRPYEQKVQIGKIAEAMSPIVKNIPPCTDAAKFSYWVTANLPVNRNEQRLLLAAGSTQERLQLALAYLNSNCEIACARCSQIITSKEHIITMSRSGTQNTFVNAMGYVHNLLTVGNVESIRYQGNQVEAYSWFPGYAWTIAVCAHCNTHLGWRFDCVENLKPTCFWGLTRQSVKFKVLASGNRLEARDDEERPQDTVATSNDMIDWDVDDEFIDENDDGE